MHGENIVLFPDSNYATEITQNVEIVCMYKIQEQTLGTIDEIATRSIEKKGDDTYYVSLSKKIPYKNISSSHSTYLIRQGPSGEKEILYDSFQYLKKGDYSVVNICLIRDIVFDCRVFPVYQTR